MEENVEGINALKNILFDLDGEWTSHNNVLKILFPGALFIY